MNKIKESLDSKLTQDEIKQINISSIDKLTKELSNELYSQQYKIRELRQVIKFLIDAYDTEK